MGPDVGGRCIVHHALDELKLPSFIKTTGSEAFMSTFPSSVANAKRGMDGSKQFATTLASLYPDLITAEYRIAKRPSKRVLVDYNQNAWGGLLPPSIP